MDWKPTQCLSFWDWHGSTHELSKMVNLSQTRSMQNAGYNALQRMKTRDDGHTSSMQVSDMQDE